MCVRTKTSYGCGCEYKTDVECHSSQCSGLERYHYPKSGDCKTCKGAGSALTRGRDGRGRYGQEINRRAQSQEDEIEPAVEAFPDTAEVGSGISPWHAPLPREKDWFSHSRRKADDAWLEEHSERNFDLQSIRESLPAYPPSERDSPVTHSPHRREARIYITDDDSPYEREDSHRRRYRREDSGRSLPVEIHSVRDVYDSPSQHRVFRRRRQDSQESFESLPSSRSSTRKYRLGPSSYKAHEHIDLHDSGYGSYGSRASDGYGRAKTEPYVYASSPAPRVISVKSPSPQPYSSYHTGYGVGPVSVVTREPAYGYSSRRH
ncbi:hypothetical protein H2200_002415 [Cladophialophora chaetospira]|uniref:Uncharacterized protein n=1 Tax=Cladophialophora chaetospira TaxID=386627 RepID=A0AA38XIY6_9EURO|nr:hypothetical protein H2200_002415 [Cladophialophora chaetospira]